MPARKARQSGKATSTSSLRPEKVEPPTETKASDDLIIASALQSLDKGRELLRKDNFKAAHTLLASALEKMDGPRVAPNHIILALSSLSQAEIRLGEVDKGLGLASKALEQATRRGVSASMKGEAHAAMGLVLHFKGDHSKALEHLQKALSLFETANDNDGIAKVCRRIGNVHVARNVYGKAVVYYTKSLKVESAGGNENEVAATKLNLARANSLQGHYPEALRDMEDLMRSSKCALIPRGLAHAHTLLGYLNLKTGNLDEAMKNYEESSRICKEIDFEMQNFFNTFGKCQVMVLKGNPKEAADRLDSEYKRMVASRTDLVIGWAMLVRGKIRRALGEMTKAQDDFKGAERFFIDGNDNLSLAEDYLEWAVTKQIAGDENGARVLANKARLIYSENKLHALENILVRVAKENGIIK